MRVWDLRAPGCQRAYESRAAVNTVVLHPNQGELISGTDAEHGVMHGAWEGTTLHHSTMALCAGSAGPSL